MDQLGDVTAQLCLVALGGAQNKQLALGLLPIHPCRTVLLGKEKEKKVEGAMCNVPYLLVCYRAVCVCVYVFVLGV